MRSRTQSRSSSRSKLSASSSNVVVVKKSTKLPMISKPQEESNGQPVNHPSGLHCGVCSQQGKRPYQEDDYSIRHDLHQHSAVPEKDKNTETHFFGLFDGHAGGRCSNHVASCLANVLAEDGAFGSNLPQAIKRSYHTTNDQFLKIAEKMKYHDGSTGICAVVRDRKILVANVGDCRALIISAGRPIQMSIDQKPTNPEEQKRIASLGGNVVYCMGVARVNRVLAVSRAFGNRTLRTVIRPDAEMMQRELTKDDDYLVLASDGLWDVLRNKDVCDMCYSPFTQSNPHIIADELVQAALTRGSMDNVTCIVVKLNDYTQRIMSSRDPPNTAFVIKEPTLMTTHSEKFTSTVSSSTAVTGVSGSARDTVLSRSASMKEATRREGSGTSALSLSQVSGACGSSLYMDALRGSATSNNSKGSGYIPSTGDENNRGSNNNSHALASLGGPYNRSTSVSAERAQSPAGTVEYDSNSFTKKSYGAASTGSPTQDSPSPVGGSCESKQQLQPLSTTGSNTFGPIRTPHQHQQQHRRTSSDSVLGHNSPIPGTNGAAAVSAGSPPSRAVAFVDSGEDRIGLDPGVGGLQQWRTRSSSSSTSSTAGRVISNEFVDDDLATITIQKPAQRIPSSTLLPPTQHTNGAIINFPTSGTGSASIPYATRRPGSSASGPTVTNSGPAGLGGLRSSLAGSMSMGMPHLISMFGNSAGNTATTTDVEPR